MFKIVFKPEALRQLKTLKRYDAVAIVDAIDRHLHEEPEKPGKSSIKRLRGAKIQPFG